VKTQNKNRLVLIAVLLLFAAPLLIAYLLNTQGWHPQNTRNSGILVEPPLPVMADAVTIAGGAKLVWRNPQWQWTLLALPGPRCETQCRTRLDEVLRMRLTLGRNAERLRIVYLGPELPMDASTAGALMSGHDDADTFAQYRAKGDDALALVLVDPNGLLMMRYPDGYSALGVRSDLQRVFH
jgi:hypothetical protein